MDLEVPELPVGYAALLRRFGLPALWTPRTSYLRAGAKREEHRADGSLRVGYPRAYDPGDETVEHLVFAVRHEGIDLRVLRAVFAEMPGVALRDAVHAQPTSQPLRRLWFLYEWLLERDLDLPDLTQGNYVPLFDPEQFVTGPARNSRRHRVRANGLGARAAMCPVVRRTPAIARQVAEAPALDARARALLDAVPAAVLWRATAFLYDRETRSSYAIERESPREGRVERFVRALREAGEARPMSRELLVRLQNAIVDDAFAETGARVEQNWVGRARADFSEEVFLLPPTPAALPGLLDAWIEFANHLTRSDDNPVPPVVGAAVLAFVFVYLHPFIDGNGRIHRWLIHWAMARRGFGPKGTVLPISAAILRDPARYDEVLDAVSRPIREHVRYAFRGASLEILDEHGDLFRHLDVTAHAEALGDWLARTVERELVDEVRFIERFDAAVAAMRAVREMPDRQERLFIQCVVQNQGRLARHKRDLFPELADLEVTALEDEVRAAFDLPPARGTVAG